MRSNAGYVYNSPVSNGPNPFSFVALNGVREYLGTIDANWQIDLSGRLRAGFANQVLASFWTRDVDAEFALQDGLDRPSPPPSIVFDD